MSISVLNSARMDSSSMSIPPGFESLFWTIAFAPLHPDLANGTPCKDAFLAAIFQKVSCRRIPEDAFSERITVLEALHDTKCLVPFLPLLHPLAKIVLTYRRPRETGGLGLRELREDVKSVVADVCISVVGEYLRGKVSVCLSVQAYFLTLNSPAL